MFLNSLLYEKKNISIFNTVICRVYKSLDIYSDTLFTHDNLDSKIVYPKNCNFKKSRKLSRSREISRSRSNLDHRESSRLRSRKMVEKFLDRKNPDESSIHPDSTIRDWQPYVQGLAKRINSFFWFVKLYNLEGF